MARKLESNEDKIRQRMKPFAVFGASLNDDFKQLIERLLFLIREHGISQFKPTPGNREEWLHFAALVHDGWKQAQTIIAEKILRNLTLRDQALLKVKEHHRLKNAAEKEKSIVEASRLQLEIKVLRRILDSIPWAIFKGEHSTIRRLSVRGGQSNLSAQNILDTLPMAHHYNEDPSKVAICTDITSFIHVGDILLADVNAGNVGFVELKSGEKNIALSHAAAFAVESECSAYEMHLKSSLTPTDVQHFDRAKKQLARGNSVVNTINNEGGTDHNTGLEIKICPIARPVECYANEIVACYEELNETKHWSINSIDNCLHLGVYNNLEHAFVGFNGWMDTIHCTSHIYNITDSFRFPWVRPFGSLNLPLEILKKVLRGEITIVVPEFKAVD